VTEIDGDFIRYGFWHKFSVFFAVYYRAAARQRIGRDFTPRWKLERK